MTQDIRDVLKLALEALEANYLLVNGTETHGGLEQCLDGYYSCCFDTDSINKQTEEALTAIREALAQPEHEREVCAKIVEESSLPDTYSEECLPDIANEIRARRQEK